MTVGTSWSRDTRVWADYRGPRNGALLVFSLSAGFNAPGSSILLNSSQQDSLQQNVGAGLDRVTASWLFVAHRRASIIDSFSHGFRTIVPEDCVGDAEEGPHRDNLRDVGRRYADITSSDAVIDYLDDYRKRNS